MGSGQRAPEGIARTPERSEGSGSGEAARTPERSEGSGSGEAARTPERSEGPGSGEAARTPERSEGPRSRQVVRYHLGDATARWRAAAGAFIGASTALAPLLLGLELLPRVGWSLSNPFWALAGAIALLVIVRMFVQYRAARRRLAALRVTLDGDALSTETSSDRLSIPRARIARIVEIEGSLGGLRVESQPDAGGLVLVASVPRGGDGFGDVRAALERWVPIERRPRLGLGVRLLFGAGVVATIFFLPFLLDDFARSKAVVAILVLLAWAVTRWTMRGR